MDSLTRGLAPVFDSISRIFTPSPERNVTYIVAASVLTTITVLNVSRLAFQGKQEKIIKGPKVTLLPELTSAEAASLTYPRDVFPGGRDVDSPYGTFRVWEWGPEDGRRVVLVHGISTPCISLGGIANGLVAKGCRVIVFDLWGRGWSDACADLEHDDRLYTTQILLAVTSSDIPWTGKDYGFSLIGYSMGGGISAVFASYFPDLVKSLVLLAPAGLIRPAHMSVRSRFLYSHGLVPESLLQFFVRRRLKAGPIISKKVIPPNVQDVVDAETKPSSIKATSEDVYAANASHILSKSHPGLTVASAVQWQIDANQGFVRAFMSSIRFAPLTGQQEAWKRLGLRKDKILIVAGNIDPIIVAHELKEDFDELVGLEKAVFRVVEGGHDLPFTNTEDVLQEITQLWQL